LLLLWRWHILFQGCAGRGDIIRIILCWVSLPRLPMLSWRLF
jgi:hypothetical protein